MMATVMMMKINRFKQIQNKQEEEKQAYKIKKQKKKNKQKKKALTIFHSKKKMELI